MTTLAERLRAARDARGWSLHEAATATKIARSYLQGLEAGTSEPTSGKLLTLAAAYQTTVAALLGEPETQETAARQAQIALVNLLVALDSGDPIRVAGAAAQGRAVCADLAPRWGYWPPVPPSSTG